MNKMHGKLVRALAIFVIVSAIAISVADACHKCGCNTCSGGCSVLQVPAPVQHQQEFSLCSSCNNPCDAPTWYPKPYCGGCSRRKSIRLNNNCGYYNNCGC